MSPGAPCTPSRHRALRLLWREALLFEDAIDGLLRIISANKSFAAVGAAGGTAVMFVLLAISSQDTFRDASGKIWSSEGWAGEAVAEVKKVVWPTRKETIQTTAAVFAFVVVMALFLWITDKSLEWALYDLLLGWKKT